MRVRLLLDIDTSPAELPADRDTIHCPPPTPAKSAVFPGPAKCLPARVLRLVSGGAK